MRIHNLLRMFTLTGIGLLISISNNAFAQFPTFDISAIKEGITSNIELVKQSKIVTDATATAGKINAGIGDAKSSMSKFAGDNLAKAQEKAEKLKKEKERIEEKKKKYDEYKEEVEAKKKEMEEAKARIAQAKAEAERIKAEAEEAKDMASSAKDLAQSKVSDAKSQAGISQEAQSSAPTAQPQVSVPVPNSNNKNYEPAVQEIQPQIERVPSTIYEQEELPQIMEEAPVADTAEGAEELEGKELAVQEERDALDHEMAELEVDAMMAQTAEEKAAIEEKKKELQERIDAFEAKNAAPEKTAAEGLTADGAVKTDAAPMGRRPFGTQALKVNTEAKAEKVSADGANSAEAKEPQAFHRAKILDGETSSDAGIEPQDFHRAKILDGETSTKMEVPESHRPKILDEYKQQQQKAPAAGGFRKRAIPMKSSSLEDGMKRQFARSFNETLVFAAAGMDEMPDGTQDGVFIVADRMARECGINVKSLEDEKVMDDCIKKLVALKSNKDSAIAQEGNAIYRSIMQETVNALTAESMAQKNIAATYEEKVLEKLEKDIANTKNSRDDTGSLAMTNKELQYLLNRILTVYSSQLSLDALLQIGGFDSSYYSKDGTVTDTADGEE